MQVCFPFPSHSSSHSHSHILICQLHVSSSCCLIILYIFGVYVCVSACVFLIDGQTAGPIRTKVGTRIQVDPGIVLGKSRTRSLSMSECRRPENGGADRDRGGVNAVGMSVEAP